MEYRISDRDDIIEECSSCVADRVASHDSINIIASTVNNSRPDVITRCSGVNDVIMTSSTNDVTDDISLTSLYSGAACTAAGSSQLRDNVNISCDQNFCAESHDVTLTHNFPKTPDAGEEFIPRFDGRVSVVTPPCPCCLCPGVHRGLETVPPRSGVNIRVRHVCTPSWSRTLGGEVRTSPGSSSTGYGSMDDRTYVCDEVMTDTPTPLCRVSISRTERDVTVCDVSDRLGFDDVIINQNDVRTDCDDMCEGLGVGTELSRLRGEGDFFAGVRGSDGPPRRAPADPVMTGSDRVLGNLMAGEGGCLPSPSYFLAQPEVQPYMRKIVTDWMLEVCEEQGCQVDVFLLAVNYLDRHLCSHPLRKSQLQLLGATCLFIASKFRETFALSAAKLVAYTDCSITVEQLLEWELVVLQALRWEVCAVTSYDYIEQILARLRVSTRHVDRVRRHTHTLIAMCATDFSFLAHPPSLMAASCVGAACRGLLGASWCLRHHTLHRLHRVIGCDTETLKACQEQIERTLLINLSPHSPPDPGLQDPSTLPGGPDGKQSSTPTDVRHIPVNQ